MCIYKTKTKTKITKWQGWLIGSCKVYLEKAVFILYNHLILWKVRINVIRCTCKDRSVIRFMLIFWDEMWLKFFGKWRVSGAFFDINAQWVECCWTLIFDQKLTKLRPSKKISSFSSGYFSNRRRQLLLFCIFTIIFYYFSLFNVLDLYWYIMSPKATK